MPRMPLELTRKSPYSYRLMKQDEQVYVCAPRLNWVGAVLAAANASSDVSVRRSARSPRRAWLHLLRYTLQLRPEARRLASLLSKSSYRI